MMGFQAKDIGLPRKSMNKFINNLVMYCIHIGKFDEIQTTKSDFLLSNKTINHKYAFEGK